MSRSMQFIMFVFLGVLFLTITTKHAKAQRVLLEEDVEEYGRVLRYGPNLLHYTHAFVEWGWTAGSEEGSGCDIMYGYSHTFAFGARYKLKLAKYYAMGLDVSYLYQMFRIKQTQDKILPSSIQHDQEKLKFNHLSIEYFNRINFGRAGNRIGNFVDFGVFLNWAFNIKHYTEDSFDTPTQDGATHQERINTNLNFTKNYNYGLRGRIGFGKYVISINYRISDLFNNRFDIELPRYSIGLQFGIHQ